MPTKSKEKHEQPPPNCRHNEIIKISTETDIEKFQIINKTISFLKRQSQQIFSQFNKEQFNENNENQDMQQTQ